MVRIRESLFGNVFRIPAASEVRLTLLILAGSLFLSMSIWKTSNYLDSRLALEQNRLRAENALDQAEIWMSGFIASYVQGLKIISQSATLRNALADPADSGEISADFLTWLEARPAIAQLRFISSDGRELIRADRRDDTIMTVDGGSLQDKSSRYYFQNTIDLPPNALYLSPIDLNIERNRIEVPWRPMVRLATPIYQSASEPTGILIMNLDATDILKAIEGTARALGQPVQVVNSEGYWLSGINPKDRFGFMFDNDMTLSSTKPGLWEAMLATQAGTVDDNHEQIVYSTMSLPALLKSRTTYDSVIAGDPELHLLIRFPEPPGFFSVRNLPGFAGLFCLCTLFSIFTAAILASRRAAEEKARAAEEQVVRLDRLAGLGALVAGVAHEMNTPIGNALMTATTVDHRAQGLAKAAHEGRIGRNSLTTTVNDIRDGVAMMSQSLQRASEIIRNFKQFAVDQTSDRRRKFALDSYILETLHLMEPQFSNAGHRVKAGHLERVTMDSFPGPLGQVLTNLLTNARVHAFRNKPHGTATVTAQTSSADQIAITVSDDGNGISPEQLEQVFIPFFSTAFGEDGTGLGLSIVESIVTGVLGGKLTIESTPGEGTRITLLIPMVAPSGDGQFANETRGPLDEKGH